MREEAAQAHAQGRSWSGTSYRLQEMEGIGGVVKKKVKRRIKVGLVVKEYEDEREHGDYLSREQRGQNRSWCSWCERLIPSDRDLCVDTLGALEHSRSSSSSASSK